MNMHGDRVRCKGSDSLRVRFGGRFSNAANEHITPCLDAYREYEFDGETRSTVSGNRVDAPPLKAAVSAWVRLPFPPNPRQIAASLDLGRQGYAGVREGVSGNF